MSQPVVGTIVAQFFAGVGETFVSNRLSQWDDQSGNNYHATQSTAGSRPYDEDQLNIGSGDDIFAARQAIAAVGFAGWLNLHASHPTNYRNMTVFLVHRRSNGALQQVNSTMALGAGFGITGGGAWFTSLGRQQWLTGTTSPLAEIACAQVTSGASVFGMHSTATGTRFCHNERIVTGSGLAPAGSGTGGFLFKGNSAGSQILNGGQVYEAVFLRDLDDAGFAEWAQWLSGKYNWGASSVYTPKTANLVMVGDSTLAGEPIYLTSTTIHERLANAYPSVHVSSAAVNGQTVSTTGGNHVDQQIFNARYLLSGSLATGETSHPQPVRVCLIMGGTNDINSGVSYATLKTAFTARVSEAKGYGATHVGICTIMDSTFHDATEDAVRASINADIENLASGIGHDFVVNLHESANGGDDRLNDATANVGGLFQDGLHPSAAGRDVIVELIRNQIQSLLSSGVITTTTPTIGSAYLVGTQYNIIWNSVGTSGAVNIKLSTDNGANFSTTLESNISDIESYSWTPTADHCGTQTVIRIEDAADDSIFDDTSAMVVATTTPGSGGGGSNSTEWSAVREILASNGIDVVRL